MTQRRTQSRGGRSTVSAQLPTPVYQALISAQRHDGNKTRSAALRRALVAGLKAPGHLAANELFVAAPCHRVWGFLNRTVQYL
jgi:hypothetical protein